MTTGTPVVVSRIQNRRGTQSQFDALYPTGQPGTGPNVLQPGEIALCTDTGRVFVGTVNLASEKGFYIELATASSTSSLTFLPQSINLPPSPAVWSPIPALDHTATPFYNILYSITDATQSPVGSPAPANTVGTNFSKNGELKITAIVTPVAPPPPDAVTLTDIGTEINNAPPVPNVLLIPPTVIPDISFRADYDGSNIRISYIHNFPANLTFSTSSIYWSTL
jgi:hypothetical protein